MLVAHELDEIPGEWSRTELDLPGDCDPREIIDAVTESGWELEDSASCGSGLLITLRNDRGHLGIVVVERSPDHAEI